MKIHVNVPDVWDTVAVEAASDSTLGDVKKEALVRTVGGHVDTSDYVAKFRGAMVLDERESLAGLGVPDGGSVIVLRSKRSPVR